MSIAKRVLINPWLLICIIGLCIYTSIVGVVYIGEIVAIGYVILKWPKLEPNLRTALNLVILWACAQLVSDKLVNDSFWNVTFKGVGAPLLMIVTIIFFYDNFIKKENRIPTLFVGLVLGMLLTRVLFEFDFLLSNPWKWGLAICVNSIFAIWYSYFRVEVSGNHKTLIIFTIIFVVFSNIVSARSISGIALFSLLIYIATKNENISIRVKNLILSKYGMIKILIIFIITFIILNYILTAIFLSDFYLNNLDEYARAKAYKQASSEYGALLGGRTESLISIKAFFDKPFFGHGSWAKDDGNYIDKYIGIVDDLGLLEGDKGASSYELGLIPTHSFILGGIVWAGFLAIFFWLYILKKISYMLFVYGRYINYFTVYVLVNLFWNIMFSPFGYDHRWETAAQIALLLHYENKYKVLYLKDKI